MGDSEKKNILLRSHYWRVLFAIGAGLALTSLPAAGALDLSSARVSLQSSLQGVSAVLAFCVGLAMVLLSQAVFGLGERTAEQSRRVHASLVQLFEEVANLDNKTNTHIEVLHQRLAEVLSLGLDYKFPLGKRLRPIHEPLIGVITDGDDYTNFDRLYSIRGARLFFEVSRLDILLLRQLVSEVYIAAVSATFVFVVFSLIATVVLTLLPGGKVADHIVLAVGGALVTYAIVELARLLSFVFKEARENLLSDATGEEQE